MFLRARSCAAALALAGVALYTESAHADAAGASRGPHCAVDLGQHQKGVTLPANAPALLVVDRSYNATPALQGSLVDGTTRTDLAAAKDTNGLLTLALPATNTAGTYSVEVAMSCSITTEADQKIVTPLTLTAPVDFPAAVGTLVHVPSDPPTGVDKIRLEPTAEMKAFLPASQLTLRVDGKESGRLQFVAASSPIEVSVNTGDACIENGALHREKPTVKVSLDGAIAGLAESPTAASVDVTVDCGAIKWTSGLDLDGDPKTPAGSNGTGSETATSSSDAGGCSASPVTTLPRGGTGLVGFGLAALAIVVTRRRRRH